MKDYIRSKVRDVLKEIDNNPDHRNIKENTTRNELIQLRTFHYNVHHIIFNPVADETANEQVNRIKELLENFDWS